VANHAGNTPKASSLGIPNAQTANQKNGNTFSREGSQKPECSEQFSTHHLLKKLAQGEFQEQLVGFVPQLHIWHDHVLIEGERVARWTIR